VLDDQDWYQSEIVGHDVLTVVREDGFGEDSGYFSRPHGCARTDDRPQFPFDKLWLLYSTPLVTGDSRLVLSPRRRGHGDLDRWDTPWLAGCVRGRDGGCGSGWPVLFFRRMIPRDPNEGGQKRSHPMEGRSIRQPLGMSLGRFACFPEPVPILDHKAECASLRGSGLGHSRSIRRRLSPNSARVTATSASWKMT
jgi:hypothetical protein